MGQALGDREHPLVRIARSGQLAAQRQYGRAPEHGDHQRLGQRRRALRQQLAPRQAEVQDQDGRARQGGVDQHHSHRTGRAPELARCVVAPCVVASRPPGAEPLQHAPDRDDQGERSQKGQRDGDPAARLGRMKRGLGRVADQPLDPGAVGLQGSEQRSPEAFLQRRRGPLEDPGGEARAAPVGDVVVGMARGRIDPFRVFQLGVQLAPPLQEGLALTSFLGVQAGARGARLGRERPKPSLHGSEFARARIGIAFGGGLRRCSLCPKFCEALLGSADRTLGLQTIDRLGHRAQGLGLRVHRGNQRRGDEDRHDWRSAIGLGQGGLRWRRRNLLRSWARNGEGGGCGRRRGGRLRSGCAQRRHRARGGMGCDGGVIALARRGLRMDARRTRQRHRQQDRGRKGAKRTDQRWLGLSHAPLHEPLDAKVEDAARSAAPLACRRSKACGRRSGPAGAAPVERDGSVARYRGYRGVRAGSGLS